MIRDIILSMRTILHVDMDAFFASAELTRHPEWRGRPIVVGAGPHERGVVSTCSYEARKYGIRSAMPSRTAYKLCPSAVFVAPDMPYYQEISARAFEVFSHYSPYVEGVSIDEAFLDITGTVHLFGSPRKLGEALRAEIAEVCALTCSVGIAGNRLLAKIGSELNKPNGLAIMPSDATEIAAMLYPRRIEILWGVGRKTAEILRRYGIVTCGDVQRLTRDGESAISRLAAIIGEASARSLTLAAFGKSDECVYWEEPAEKSVSREHTFSTDESNREAARNRLLELASEVGYRFRRAERWARTAKLKMRTCDFATFTRQILFSRPSRDDIAFKRAAAELFDREWPAGKKLSLRLIGFGVANFQNFPDDEQPALFDDPKDETRRKHERLSSAIDALRDKGLL